MADIPLGNIQRQMAGLGAVEASAPASIVSGFASGFKQGGRDARQILQNEEARRRLVAQEDARVRQQAQEAADAQAAMFALGGAPAGGVGARRSSSGGGAVAPGGDFSAPQFTLEGVAEEVTAVPRDQYEQAQSISDMVEVLRAGDVLDVEEIATLGQIHPEVAEAVRASQAPSEELVNIQAAIESSETNPYLAGLPLGASEVAAQQAAAQRRVDEREAAAVALEGILAQQEAERVPAVYNPLEDLGYRRDLMPERSAVVQLLETDPQFRSASPDAKRAFVQRYDEFYSRVGKQQSANIAAEWADQLRRYTDRVANTLAAELSAWEIELAPTQLQGMVELYVSGGKGAVEKAIASMTKQKEFKLSEGRLWSSLNLDRAKFAEQQDKRRDVESGALAEQQRRVREEFEPQVDALAEREGALAAREASVGLTPEVVASLSALQDDKLALQARIDEAEDRAARQAAMVGAAPSTFGRAGQPPADGAEGGDVADAMKRRSELLKTYARTELEGKKLSQKQLQAVLKAVGDIAIAGGRTNEKIKKLGETLADKAQDLGVEVDTDIFEDFEAKSAAIPGFREEWDYLSGVIGGAGATPRSFGGGGGGDSTMPPDWPGEGWILGALPPSKGGGEVWFNKSLPAGQNTRPRTD